MDHRDIAAATHPWWKKDSIDDRSMTLTAVVRDSEGDEIELTDIPFRYEVCRVCGGKGKHVNPNIDRQGISQDEFDADPDFFKDYRRGVYDISCLLCGGKRVVPVPDESRAWDDPDHQEMVLSHIEWIAQEARDIVHETEMGY